MHEAAGSIRLRGFVAGVICLLFMYNILSHPYMQVSTRVSCMSWPMRKL